MPATEPGRPGRPRDAAVDRRVREAAIALLAEGGYAALTVEAAAARAGVGRPTIYRRWHDRSALAVDAVEAAFAEANPTVPDTGDPRADLVTLLANTITLLTASPLGAVVRGLVPELDRAPDLAAAVRAFERRRRGLLLAALDRAAAAGLLRPGLTSNCAVELLLGPVYLRLLVTRDPLAPGDAAALVDAVLEPDGDA